MDEFERSQSAHRKPDTDQVKASNGLMSAPVPEPPLVRARPRHVILKAFATISIFPTADMVLDSVRARIPVKPVWAALSARKMRRKPAKP
jgi:hypothetical protein